MLVTVHAFCTGVVQICRKASQIAALFLHEQASRLVSALVSSSAVRHSMKTYHSLIKCVLCYRTCLIYLNSTECTALALLCSTPPVTKLLSAHVTLCRSFKSFKFRQVEAADVSDAP